MLPSRTEPLVTNARHYDALHKSHEAPARFIRTRQSSDRRLHCHVDIRQALHHLGEITGSISPMICWIRSFRGFVLGNNTLNMFIISQNLLCKNTYIWFGALLTTKIYCQKNLTTKSLSFGCKDAPAKLHLFLVLFH